MKRKRVLEADLDPPNTPRTRPGAETAKRAHALTRRKPGRRSKGSSVERPGTYAAERAVKDIKRRREEET